MACLGYCHHLLEGTCIIARCDSCEVGCGGCSCSKVFLVDTHRRLLELSTSQGFGTTHAGLPTVNPEDEKKATKAVGPKPRVMRSPQCRRKPIMSQHCSSDS